MKTMMIIFIATLVIGFPVLYGCMWLTEIGYRRGIAEDPHLTEESVYVTYDCSDYTIRIEAFIKSEPNLPLDKICEIYNRFDNARKESMPIKKSTERFYGAPGTSSKYIESYNHDRVGN